MLPPHSKLTDNANRMTSKLFHFTKTLSCFGMKTPLQETAIDIGQEILLLDNGIQLSCVAVIMMFICLYKENRRQNYVSFCIDDTVAIDRKTWPMFM